MALEWRSSPLYTPYPRQGFASPLSLDILFDYSSLSASTSLKFTCFWLLWRKKQNLPWFQAQDPESLGGSRRNLAGPCHKHPTILFTNASKEDAEREEEEEERVMGKRWGGKVTFGGGFWSLGRAPPPALFRAAALHCTARHMIDKMSQSLSISSTPRPSPARESQKEAWP
ncbi:hypothetical protein H6P81_004388 [Aristolochia fimbriata]|uniref:Uncharacterized protein n=1 Tax=Aristolochia fimbriata TaxID=158543 RepID=A0AAV7FHH8_ARIFI|nr:hypothetical protein H6P81_004388 [Aristolochia fimbriata]